MYETLEKIQLILRCIYTVPAPFKLWKTNQNIFLVYFYMITMILYDFYMIHFLKTRIHYTFSDLSTEPRIWNLYLTLLYFPSWK